PRGGSGRGRARCQKENFDRAGQLGKAGGPTSPCLSAPAISRGAMPERKEREFALVDLQSSETFAVQSAALQGSRADAERALLQLKCAGRVLTQDFPLRGLGQVGPIGNFADDAVKRMVRMGIIGREAQIVITQTTDELGEHPLLAVGGNKALTFEIF